MQRDSSRPPLLVQLVVYYATITLLTGRSCSGMLSFSLEQYVDTPYKRCTRSSLALLLPLLLILLTDNNSLHYQTDAESAECSECRQ
jgi:hypothetical protein